MEILTDPPIKSKDQDRLDRAPLAQEVAGMLLSYNGEESFVVGTEGVWGSGKTSFIEMILEAISKTPKAKRPVCIKFNPWNFSNIDAVYIDFFTQLGEGIGDNKKYIDYGKKLLQRIEVEPSFFGITFGKFSLGGNKDSLQDLRRDIEKHLREKKRKIIIVVDDIDRLDKEETREVFKLVKVNANFPNVIYLLAYDRDKVEQMLGDAGFPGAEYLKKIVQVSFTLPKPPQSKLYSILGQELDKTLDSKKIKSVIDKYWDNKRWGNLAESGFKYVFKTIRDINRFVSSWQLDYLIVGYNEVNPIDFLGIELIRVFAPQMYAAISENKELFTKTDSLYAGSGSNDKDTRKKLFTEILSKAPEEIRDNILQVCRQIFPQIDGIYTNMTYGHDWAQGWRKDIRVCSSDYFDTYFLLSVPDGKVSQLELNAIFATLRNPKAFASNLKQIKQSNKLKAIFDGTMDRMDKFSYQERENLLQALFDAGDYIDEEKYGGLADIENSERKIRRLCYHALMKIEAKDRYKELKKLIISSTSIYTPLFLGGYLVKEYEDHEKDSSKDKPLLSEKKEIEELKKIMVDKIEKYAKKPEFKKHRNLAPLLIWWRLLSLTPSNATNYTKKFLNNKSDLFRLLEVFKTYIISQTLGDYVSTRKAKIDTVSLENLIGIDKINAAINKYSKGKLTKSQKELFQLFEDSVKGKDD